MSDGEKLLLVLSFAILAVTIGAAFAASSESGDRIATGIVSDVNVSAHTIRFQVNGGEPTFNASLREFPELSSLKRDTRIRVYFTESLKVTDYKIFEGGRWISREEFARRRKEVDAGK